MVDDPNQDPNDNSSNRRQRPGNSGGKNPLIYFLPQIAGFLLRNPKIGLPLLIIGGIGFFFFKGCGNNIVAPQNSSSSSYAKGCDMDQKVYDQAEVYEGLYPDNTKNPMPEQVSLLKYCPDRGNQGQQGSCVAWSSAYAARTILQARATGENPNDIVFSPSYLYNQIKLDGCQGSYIQLAMETMQKNGGLPLREFPYTDEDCNKKPTAYELKKASQFNIRGAQRLTLDGDDYHVNMLAIKQNLNQGGPVVIGMKVGGSFMQEMLGQEVWVPTESDYEMNGFGGHAMCVIGYDDNKAGGSFQIMNSWGKEWGKNGICFVRYNDFETFVVEAYGLYPMGNITKNHPTQFKVEFGMVEMNTDNSIKSYIPISNIRDNIFVCDRPLKKGQTRFKLEVTNSIECYTYVFGQETDGSGYTLFPYTPKHSPYCGITGTRLFPAKQSMQPDQAGNRDVFAIVVSKKPLDYKEIVTSINKTKGAFSQRIQSVLGDILIDNLNFTAGETFGFKTESNGSKQAVAMIIEVPKN
jgi:C1A family cysteine protease